MLERETVDEMIYNTKRVRDRLILELQARCGLRIGELLKIKVSDISDRTITLREPKSGKESELAYMPENVSKKLAEYVKDKALQSDDRPFPICYSSLFNNSVLNHENRQYHMMLAVQYWCSILRKRSNILK